LTNVISSIRSFCRQNYSQFQVVFGVCDASDPALGVVRRLQNEFPGLDIDLVIDSHEHGQNLKINSLINMMARARHDVLVLSDSDALVDADYLASVIPELSGRKVGLVTCLYHGEPTGHVWSRLGAMYINEWYMPSVLLAWLFGHDSYVSGQSVCLRRDTIARNGRLPEHRQSSRGRL
jgi:ceramide glucosyltransferase